MQNTLTALDVAVSLGAVAVAAVAHVPLFVNVKRVGAMWHWRVGRLGGSVYLARRPAPARKAVVRPVEFRSSVSGNHKRRRLAEALAFGVAILPSVSRSW